VEGKSSFEEVGLADAHSQRAVSILETARTFLAAPAWGLGTAALASLLDADLPRVSAAATSTAMDACGPCFAHRSQSQRVIFLYMSGGPSHLETFDHKPKLAEL